MHCQDRAWAHKGPLGVDINRTRSTDRGTWRLRFGKRRLCVFPISEPINFVAKIDFWRGSQKLSPLTCSWVLATLHCLFCLSTRCQEQTLISNRLALVALRGKLANGRRWHSKCRLEVCLVEGKWKGEEEGEGFGSFSKSRLAPMKC